MVSPVRDWLRTCHKACLILLLLLMSEWPTYFPGRSSSASFMFAYSFLIPSESDRVCHCTPPVLQEAFCNSDFVIIGRHRQQTIQMANVNNSLITRVYGVKVHASLKGDLRWGRQYKLHYVEGGGAGCGWKSKSNYFMPRTKYLIAGIRDNGLLLVSTCFWHERVSDLSHLQIFSLFHDVYKGVCHHKKYRDCALSQTTPGSEELCQYNHELKSCYSRYAVCIPTPTCQFTHEPQRDLLPLLSSTQQTHEGRPYPVTPRLYEQVSKIMESYQPNTTHDYFLQCQQRVLLNQFHSSD